MGKGVMVTVGKTPGGIGCGSNGMRVDGNGGRMG